MFKGRHKLWIAKDTSKDPLIEAKEHEGDTAGQSNSNSESTAFKLGDPHFDDEKWVPGIPKSVTVISGTVL